MNEILKLLLDWAEAWGPLIPLIFLLFKRNQPSFLKPVIVYLFFAFLINLAADIMSEMNVYLQRGHHISNSILYNIHSIVRFMCFSYFFIGLKQTSFVKIKYIIPVLSLLILIINFKYLEYFGNPKHISGNLLSSEAYFLLIYCMLYYLSKLRDEVDDIASGPDFWVVTGLSIYVVINFFVFLFYVPMIEQNSQLANDMWNIHNIAYIILCIFITKAFYEPARYQYTV